MSQVSINRSLAGWLLVLPILGAMAFSDLAGEDSLTADEKRFYMAAEPNRLAWVSAEMATAEDGRINWDALPEDIRGSYEAIRTWQPFQIGKSEDGSPIFDPWQSHAIPGFGAYWGPSFYDAIGRLPSNSLDKLVGNARYVVEGIVTRREQGFFIDEPMTLLTLEVSRIAPPNKNDKILVANRTPMTDVLYVAYPSAHFIIGGHGFAKGDPAYPRLPNLGDKVLFFEFGLALDVDRLIFRPEADKILVQQPGGSLNSMDYLQSWADTNKREVPATLETVAETVAERRVFEAVGSGGES